jgi:hypothetical protein
MRVDTLTIKPWIIFFIFPFIIGPMIILIDYISSILNSGIATFFGTLVVLASYFLYPFLVGLRLRTILSSHPLYTRKSNASLIFDCSLIAIPCATQELLRYHEGGFNIFLGAIGVLGIVGIVRLASFPAHEIKSIELKRNAGIWEYVSETFQMLYWPLGALWMQPRINSISNKKKITISE